MRCVEELVCPHDGHQILGIGKVDDVVIERLDMFSDLVQFLLRNFAKESKASLKAFVGGTYKLENTL